MFGKTFTDHMIQVEWSRLDGWKDPLIKPYGPLHLYPSSSVFHYATEVKKMLSLYLTIITLLFFSALKG